jgi:diguanylate cyclase (GGDEF)-like protein
MTNGDDSSLTAAQRPGTTGRHLLFGIASGGIVVVVGLLIALAERRLPPATVWDGSIFVDERLLWVIGLAPVVQGVTFWLVGRSRARLESELADRRAAEAESRRRAAHDELTGLPNRTALYDRLDRGGVAALSILAVDGFEKVNDTLGPTVGDELLRVVAGRLVAEAVVRGLAVHRLDGDEFAVVVPERPGETAIAEIEVAAAAITALFARPFVVGTAAIRTSVSIGVCRVVEPIGSRELLRRAEVALRVAERRPGDGVEVFDEAMDAALRARCALERDLVRALSADEFVVHYQSIHDAATGRTTACEALVRWASPSRGLVGPGDFIDIAEETGLIVELGRLVLGEACREAAGWPRSIGVAVNVSPVQLRDSGFLADLRRVLTLTGLEPERLRLEITESLFVEDRDDVVRLLDRIRALGVRVSLDDFGTGYSNLAYLHRIPLDRIKIDAVFVRRMTVDPADARLVGAMVRLARELDKTVTIEGIERPEQLAMVTGFGVDEVQGFLFSRPVAASALAFSGGPEPVAASSGGSRVSAAGTPCGSALDRRQIGPDFSHLPEASDAG